MKKAWIVGTAVGLLLSLAVIGFMHYEMSQPASAVSAAPATVQPQPGWSKPSADFLAQWDAYVALQKKIDQESQAITQSKAVRTLKDDYDLAQGKRDSIVKAVPDGFTFDTDKRYLIPKPKPAPVDPNLAWRRAPPFVL